MMLQSLDILIGVAVVMLLASMATMLVTQGIVSLLQSRGRHLREGLVELLQQIDPGVTSGIAFEVAEAILMHPLIRGSRRRLGSVIKREELTSLLLELADESKAARSDTGVTPSARAVLNGAMKANGITAPHDMLVNIRTRMLELERTHPDMPAATRQTVAITGEAPTEFIAKLHAWFDGTMDRVSERFTFSTRLVTFMSAIVVAFGLQIDTLGLINRLSVDPAFRRALVEQGIRMRAAPDAQQTATGVANAPAGAAAPAPQGPPTHAANPQLPQMDREAVTRALANAGIVAAPDLGTWLTNWSQVNILGVGLSVFLLSLCAPFWFNVLSDTLRLRSILAGQDDAERTDRQERRPHGVE